jgi:uncharacterized membrane protein
MVIVAVLVTVGLIKTVFVGVKLHVGVFVGE